MTSILCNSADLDVKWARPRLKNVLRKGQKAVILAASDFADVHDQKSWEADYGPGGMWNQAYEGGLRAYGITDITWLSPFRDERARMVVELGSADVIVLPGGAPDRFMKQIRRFGLKKVLKAHKGVFVGVSAGAMILLENYHISPDDDYDDFSWQTGLGLYDFDVEMHYTGRQIGHTRRAVAEKGLPTYAISEKGAVLVEDDVVTLLGNVDCF